MHKFPAALALALALTACHGKNKSTGQRAAEGQVLKGSISDAMLPYDTVTSQPPLAPPTTDRGTSADASSAGSADSAGDAASSAVASGTPEPVQTP